MAPNPLFDIIIGNEARGKEHIRFDVRYVPTYSQADRNRMIEQGKEKELHELSRWIIPTTRNAADYHNKYKLVAVQPATQAFRDLSMEMGGAWRHFGMQIEDGEIFCLQAFYKNGEFGAPPQQGNVLIRTRSKGPMQRIFMDLLNVPGKSTYSRAAFEGRFDIIDLPTAIRSGALYSQNTAPLFNKPFERCARLQYIQLQNEIERPPTLAITEVIDSTGEVIEVARTRRRRVMQGLE